MQLTLGELAERLGAELRGDATVVIRSAAGIKEAGDGDITFLANGKYRPFLDATAASAVIVGTDIEPGQVPTLVSSDPYRSFLEVLRIFSPEPDRPLTGIDPTAIIDPGARIGERVAIGPHAIVRAGAVLGDDVIVMSGCYVGARSVVGERSWLYPNVVVREDVRIGARCILHASCVIGSDGFGFVGSPEGHAKIPQIGGVIIEDDVEIGANSAIDRATTGATRVGRGTKIDNLVHIAHNVEIGPHSVLCAQVGISGSTKLGRFVTLAGQAGLVGHIEVGDGARVGAQGGVTKSIPQGETVSGYPATNHTKAQKVYASMRHLPDALRSLREMERRVTELESRLEAAEGSPPKPMVEDGPASSSSGSPAGAAEVARSGNEPNGTSRPVRAHVEVSGGRKE